MHIDEFKIENKTGEQGDDWPQDSVQDASCADGVCGVNFGSDAPEVDFGALASLGNPTESRNGAESESES